jgi:hypothetical protein
MDIDKEFLNLQSTFESLEKVTLRPPESSQKEQPSPKKTREEGVKKTSGVFEKIVIKSEGEKITFETKSEASKKSTWLTKFSRKKEYQFEPVVKKLENQLKELIGKKDSLKADQLKQLEGWSEEYNKFITAAAGRKFKPTWINPRSWINPGRKQNEFLRAHLVEQQVLDKLASAEKMAGKAERTAELQVHYKALASLEDKWQRASIDYRGEEGGDLAKHLDQRIGHGSSDDSIHTLMKESAQKIKTRLEKVTAQKVNTQEQRQHYKDEIGEIQHALKKFKELVVAFQSIAEVDKSFTQYEDDKLKVKSKKIEYFWKIIAQELIHEVGYKITDLKSLEQVKKTVENYQDRIKPLLPLLEYIDTSFANIEKSIQSSGKTEELSYARKQVIQVASEFTKLAKAELGASRHKALPVAVNEAISSVLTTLREIDAFREKQVSEVEASLRDDGPAAVKDLRAETYTTVFSGFKSITEAIQKARGNPSELESTVKAVQESFTKLERTLASIKKTHQEHFESIGKIEQERLVVVASANKLREQVEALKKETRKTPAKSLPRVPSPTSATKVASPRPVVQSSPVKPPARPPVVVRASTPAKTPPETSLIGMLKNLKKDAEESLKEARKNVGDLFKETGETVKEAVEEQRAQAKQLKEDVAEGVEQVKEKGQEMLLQATIKHILDDLVEIDKTKIPPAEYSTQEVVRKARLEDMRFKLKDLNEKLKECQKDYDILTGKIAPPT